MTKIKETFTIDEKVLEKFNDFCKENKHYNASALLNDIVKTFLENEEKNIKNK